MKLSEYRKMYLLEDIHFWFLGKRLFIKAFLERYADCIKKILDVGAGTGGLTHYLERYGGVTGLEENNTAIHLARKRGINVVKGNAQKLPFAGKSFDLVTLIDVLYHKKIKNELTVLREVARVLKPNGLILIVDSAFDFLKSSHDQAMHGARRFTIARIETLLKNSDFQPLRSSYTFISLFPLIVIKRLVINRFLKEKTSDAREVPSWLNQLFLFFLKIESSLLRFITFPFGSSLIVLARKIDKDEKFVD